MFIDRFSMPMIKKTLDTMNKIGVDKLFSKSYSGIGSILMFHRIVDKKDDIVRNVGGELYVDDFKHLISYLKDNNYEFISLNDVFDILKNNKSLDNKKFISFTFDDGYLDNFTIAYPILKEHNIPFTIYITTDIADQRYIFWKYYIRDLIVKNDQIIVDEGRINISIKCKNIDQKESAFKKLRRIMINYTDSQRYKILPIFAKKYGINAQDYMNFGMNWENIIEIAKDPLCSIGNHTISHSNMNTLTDDEFDNQIKKSNQIINENIGYIPSHFAFPFGSPKELTKREKTKIKEFKFKTCVTTLMGNIFLNHKDYLNCLPRIPINGYLYNENYLKMLLSGSVPALTNNFGKIVH